MTAGLSGSGKSTIMRAVNRLNTVARGTVLVEHLGEPVDVVTCNEATLRDVRMRTVSMVFQQFALLPWRTVRENVGFGLELRGIAAAERKRIVDEQLALVGLSKWADKHAHELSGGMQQRVGIARALAQQPQLILADEPVASLDPATAVRVMALLRRVCHDNGITLVASLHQVDLALEHADRIVGLAHGEIVHDSPASDVTDDAIQLIYEGVTEESDGDTVASTVTGHLAAGVR